jgi:hypothetical protein
VSMSNPTDRVEIITSRRRRWTARRPLSGHDDKFGGSLTWRCPEPALHLAPAGGGGGADGCRQLRTGGAGLRLSGFAEPGARAPRVLLGKKTLEAEIL